MRRLRRMLSVLGSAMLVTVLVSGCIGGPTHGLGDEPREGLSPYGEICPEETMAVILALRNDPGFVLLDIRTPVEVEAGHLPGAESIDFRSPDFKSRMDRLDRDPIYLIYCRTANRSGQAFDLMSKMGFTKVYDMQGGIRLWAELNYPICVGAGGPEHVCTVEYPGTPVGV